MRTISLFLLMFLCVEADAQPGLVPMAFPGAEGYGSHAIGGRYGKVIFITTLEDYDHDEEQIKGSFRYAVTRDYPRIIVFRVSGYIELKREVVITDSYITIAGHTAPGEGICLKNHGLRIRAHDVVVRFLRVRPGDTYGMHHPGWSTDAITVSNPSKNVIIDHCSTRWSNDEVITLSGDQVDSVTVQWCIISESLARSTHRKGEHGYASLVRTGGNASFHHNIYAHHVSRVPRPGTYGNRSGFLDFRNNLIYNTRQGGYTAKDSAKLNYVCNYVKQGPDSEKSYVFRVGGESTMVYFSGNELYARDGSLITDNQEVLISDIEDGTELDHPFPSAPMRTDATAELPCMLFKNAGAISPHRDNVDKRILNEIRSGSGKIINTQRESGGWPSLQPGRLTTDRDMDGMDDQWEESMGLSVTDAGDSGEHDLSKDYTNIEVYLSELAQSKK